MSEDRAEYQRYLRRTRKAYAIQKLGGVCVLCGSASSLEFDHIDPTDKTERISRLYYNSIDVLDAELVKCQLLCKKCHREKTNKELPSVEHGGGVVGKFHCKCDLCKAKKAAYTREWRQLRK